MRDVIILLDGKLRIATDQDYTPGQQVVHRARYGTRIELRDGWLTEVSERRLFAVKPAQGTDEFLVVATAPVVAWLPPLADRGKKVCDRIKPMNNETHPAAENAAAATAAD